MRWLSSKSKSNFINFNVQVYTQRNSVMIKPNTIIVSLSAVVSNCEVTVIHSETVPVDLSRPQCVSLLVVVVRFQGPLHLVISDCFV